MKKKLVILTGAGISAESGIKKPLVTDSGKVIMFKTSLHQKVLKNPALVLDFITKDN
jgi:hypothetical protein